MVNINDSATVYPVLNAKEIFQSPQYQEVLLKLRGRISKDNEIYKEDYLALFYNFAEFVQNFSGVQDQGPGGILNFSLLRSLEVLQYSFEQKTFTDDISYVLLCLALLGEIGQVYANQRIIICNKDGDYFKVWDPFHEDLYAKNRYYRIIEISGLPSSHGRVLNPHFAMRVIPRNAWQKIAANPPLMHRFLLALGTNDDDAEELKGVLDLLNQRVHKQRKIKLSNLDVEGNIPAHLLEAQKFWHWLCEAIEAKKIAVNDSKSGVHGTKGGVLVNVDVLGRQYLRDKQRKISVIALSEAMVAAGFVAQGVYSYQVNGKGGGHTVANPFRDEAKNIDLSRGVIANTGGIQFARMVNNPVFIAALSSPFKSEAIKLMQQKNPNNPNRPRPGFPGGGK